MQVKPAVADDVFVTLVIWSANQVPAEGAVDNHASVCVCVLWECAQCVCVCNCKRESKRALNSYYIAFKLKSAEPTPSWDAVCWSCSRFLLSASPIISQQHCKLQSSGKCHLSCLRWPWATSHGMLSHTFGNVSFLLMTVLKVCDQ